MAKVPPFGELIAATTTSAVHLEMRDAYTPDDQRFLDWQAGKLLPEHGESGVVGHRALPHGPGSSFPPCPCRL